MSFAKKVAIIGGGAILVGGSVYAINNLMNLEKIDVSFQKPRIHKLDLSGIEIRTDIALKNTTSAKATITQPFVTLMNKGKLLARTPLADKTFQIQPNKTTIIENYKINVALIPFLETLGTGIVNIIPIVTNIFEKGKTIQERMEALQQAQLGLDLAARIELFANQWKITKNERIKL